MLLSKYSQGKNQGQIWSNKVKWGEMKSDKVNDFKEVKDKHTQKSKIHCKSDVATHKENCDSKQFHF